MKKLCLAILAIAIFAVALHAEQVISSFMMYDSDHEIQITEDYMRLVECCTKEMDLYSEPYLAIEDGDVSQFVAWLTEAKTKHIEWKKTADDNKITDIKKQYTLTAPCPGVFIFWEWGSWYRSASKVVLIPRFVAVAGEIYTIMSVEGEIPSSQNEFIAFTQENLLVFKSSDEIQSLIDALDSKHIKAWEDRLELFK